MSFSCMLNIGDFINMHNKAILHQTDRKTQAFVKLCNCRDLSICSLKGRCKEGLIMCKVHVKGNLKFRIYNYKQSLELKDKKHATELLAVWNAKDVEKNPLIEWSIVKHAPPYQCGSKTSQLCLADKMMTRKTC